MRILIWVLSYLLLIISLIYVITVKIGIGMASF